MDRLKESLLSFAATLWALLASASSASAQDAHRHSAPESPWMQFLRENGRWLQIGGGVLLVGAIVVFFLIRRAKAPMTQSAQPPAPGEASK